MVANRFAFAVAAPPAGMTQQRPVKNFDSSPTPSTWYKEFGAHFADGDVPSGSIVEWRKTDGTTVITSQGDNFVYWASGALRSYSVTALHSGAIANGASTIWKAYPTVGAWDNTSWGTTSLITARDIRMEITISGVTYTLGANNEVTRGTNIRQVRSGPLSASWRIFGEFRNGTGSGSTPQGDIWGFLYLTFFSDGTYSAWGTIQNGRSTDNTPQAYTVTDYKLKDYVGPTTLFDYSSSFTFYAGSPVYCCSTDGLHPYTGTSVDKCVVGFPTLVLADPTTTGIYDSAAIWWYVSSSTMLANIPGATSDTYIPNAVGQFGDPNQTGGNIWIGPMTQPAVSALLLANWDYLRGDRVNAFAGSVNQGSFWNATAGYPANFSGGTYSGLPAASTSIGWGPGGTFTISGGTDPSWSGSDDPKNGSHAPLYTWYQYLATGQEPWLDILFDQCIGFMGYQNPGTANYARNPSINGHSYTGVYSCLSQTRGLGWNIRNIDNTEWVTPDAHPMKPYLGDIIAEQLAAVDDFIQPSNTPAGAATLGVYDGGEDGNGNNSGWMHDYLVTSYSMLVRRERTTTSNGFVQFHVIPWCFGRGVNGCMYGACSYQIGLGQGASPTYPSIVYPTAWSQVWIGGGVPNAYEITKPNNPSCPGSGTNTDVAVVGSNGYEVGHTYPVIFQVAAACGQIAGISTAPTVYTYQTAVEVAAGISEASWGSASTGPIWRIRIPQ